MLPFLPPRKSFADYPSVQALRDTIQEQIAQGLAAGLFKPTDFTGVKKSEIQIPVRDGTSLRALLYIPKKWDKGSNVRLLPRWRIHIWIR
jgi:predicted acyl esterase